MAKRKDPRVADWTDDIIILNDNYAKLGIKKGYIGSVVDSIVDKGFLLVDFRDAMNDEVIATLVEIKYEDCVVFTKTLKEDQLASKAYDQIMIERKNG